MTTRVLHNYSICCLSSLSTSLWTLNDSLRSSSWLSGSCSSESPDSCNLSRLQSIPNLAEKYKIWKKCNLYFKRRCYHLGNFTLYAISKKSIKWRGKQLAHQPGPISRVDFGTSLASNNTIAILGQKSMYTYFLHIFSPNVAASREEWRNFLKISTLVLYFVMRALFFLLTRTLWWLLPKSSSYYIVWFTKRREISN